MRKNVDLYTSNVRKHTDWCHDASGEHKLIYYDATEKGKHRVILALAGYL